MGCLKQQRNLEISDMKPVFVDLMLNGDWGVQLVAL